MARTNVAVAQAPVLTHNGGQAFRHLTPIQALRRSVCACMLFEAEFYEDGDTVASRIASLIPLCDPADVSALAIQARSTMNLRHVPLLLAAHLSQVTKGPIVGRTVEGVIQRADELAELLAILSKITGKPPKKAVTHQVRKGLARAFTKFNAHALAKYNRDGAIKLRDALFLAHAKPVNEDVAATYKALAEQTLASPDTWEVALSAGADKKATWERLIGEGKLGYLALLRNLRNMMAVGVDRDLVATAIGERKGGAERVLPFRFVAAARACPQLEAPLDKSLCKTIAALPKLPGTTLVLVDVSGSMEAPLSAKSDMTRMDAAATLASMINGNLRVFSFSNRLVEVPARRGMAGVDAVCKSQPHSGTALFDAVAEAQANVHDRIIVLTDEQANGPDAGPYGFRLSGTLREMPKPVCPNAYVVNVASAQNGVGYGPWTHLDGFSESVLRWIVESEREQ